MKFLVVPESISVEVLMIFHFPCSEMGKLMVYCWGLLQVHG